jgi:hypothetical protein
MVERRGYRRDEETCLADWDEAISWASASATHARVGGLQGPALRPIADESLHRSGNDEMRHKLSWSIV